MAILWSTEGDSTEITVSGRGVTYLTGFFPRPETFFPVFCGSPGHHLQGFKEVLATPDLSKREESTWPKQINCLRILLCFMSFLIQLPPDFANICLNVNHFYIAGFAGLERHWQRSTGQKSTRRIQEIVQVCVYEITRIIFNVRKWHYFSIILFSIPIVRVCPRSTNNRASLRKPSCSGQVLMLEKGQMFMTSGLRIYFTSS